MKKAFQNNNPNDSSEFVKFSAHQFDRDRFLPSNLSTRCTVNLPSKNTLQGRTDHGIKSYVKKLMCTGSTWIKYFAMDGNGVSGTDNERRIID